MHFPAPVRAAVGLLAAAADEARRFPDRAIEVPMLVVSTALQASLRAQQRYARLTARGDQVLSRRPPTAAPPAWATFDEPVSMGDLHRAAEADTSMGRGAGGAASKAETPAQAPGSKSSGSKSSGSKSPASQAPAKPVRKPKKVNKPRHTAQSPFDAVDDSD